MKDGYYFFLNRSDEFEEPENIDYIMEEYLPSLVITVDCGISCAKEVEYLKDLAVDVIVTDHHELPEVLPDCIVINSREICAASLARTRT